MLYSNTLNEIADNINTGIEYEIALFYQLVCADEQRQILTAINKRADKDKVLNIIRQTDITPIIVALQKRGLQLSDATFETQNDEVGPSDVVMYICDTKKEKYKIGLSAKYDNSCTCNCSHHYFISASDKNNIKAKLPEYAMRHIEKMNELFGDISFWFRNRKCKYSDISNEYIDLIRNCIIYNWRRKSQQEKRSILSVLLQMISPIEFWVCTFTKNKDIKLNTTPFRIKPEEVNRVKLTKNAGQFIQFSIDSNVFAQMQVKFNNGIIEKYKCKRKLPDIEYNGVKIKYGDPFGSWNFSVKG